MAKSFDNVKNDLMMQTGRLPAPPPAAVKPPESSQSLTIEYGNGKFTVNGKESFSSLESLEEYMIQFFGIKEDESAEMPEASGMPAPTEDNSL